MTFTLLLPTLNEIEGMKAVMPEIKREWVDKIIVVDGGSTDGTVDYAKQLGIPVHIQKKSGIRNAYIEALEFIDTDIVITFSPDGNSLACKIPPLVEKMKEGYDMVIVSRYAEGAKSDDDDAVTGFGNWLFTFMINLLHGSKYTDAMVMFRAWKVSVFKELHMDKEESYVTEEKLFGTKVGCEPLLSIRAAKRKLKCAEIPGDEPARIGGTRKLQIIRWGMAYMYEIIREKFVG